MKYDKLKIYYDAEFTGLNRNTTLISIGMVSESGSKFYAEFTDYDESQLNDWLKENVIKNLYLSHELSQTSTYDGRFDLNTRGNSKLIKEELLRWLYNEYKVSGKQIQFFTDCYAYDWVLLQNLICEFGDALNIPEYINYIPIDLSTLLYMTGTDPDINREKFACIDDNSEFVSNKHNSLHDAKIAKKCFENIQYNVKNGIY